MSIIEVRFIQCIYEYNCIGVLMHNGKILGYGYRVASYW